MKSVIDIQSLKKSITNIGKIIKSSKKKYTWEFILEDKKFILDLLVSKISSKKRIIINQEKVFEKKIKENFIYEIYLQLHNITIKQRENNFVLLLDGFLFDQKKKKVHFKNDFENKKKKIENNKNNKFLKKGKSCYLEKKEVLDKKCLKPSQSESLLIAVGSDFSRFSDFSLNSNSEMD